MTTSSLPPTLPLHARYRMELDTRMQKIFSALPSSDVTMARSLQQRSWGESDRRFWQDYFMIDANRYKQMVLGLLGYCVRDSASLRGLMDVVRVSLMEVEKHKRPRAKKSVVLKNVGIEWSFIASNTLEWNTAVSYALEYGIDLKKVMLDRLEDREPPLKASVLAHLLHVDTTFGIKILREMATSSLFYNSDDVRYALECTVPCLPRESLLSLCSKLDVDFLGPMYKGESSLLDWLQVYVACTKPDMTKNSSRIVREFAAWLHSTGQVDAHVQKNIPKHMAILASWLFPEHLPKTLELQHLPLNNVYDYFPMAMTSENFSSGELAFNSWIENSDEALANVLASLASTFQKYMRGLVVQREHQDYARWNEAFRLSESNNHPEALQWCVLQHYRPKWNLERIQTMHAMVLATGFGSDPGQTEHWRSLLESARADISMACVASDVFSELALGTS
jgi:hypothetical protein